MNAKYLLGSLFATPLLPIMYFQAKKIRASVPKLPEASGTSGKVSLTGQENLNLLVIGESTVAGVGVKTHEEGFAGTLAKELSTCFNKTITWKVYARSGYTAQRVNAKILPKISETGFDLIVIGLGGNDAFTLNSPVKWKAQVQELINNLRERFGDTPIFFTNMPPIKEFPAFTKTIKFVVGNLVELLGKQLEKLVAYNKNTYYSSEVITVRGWVKRLGIKEKDNTFFSDGVHPSKFTYQVWARDMSQFICDRYQAVE